MAKSFYTKKEWSKLFSDLLMVAKKCNYFPRPAYNNQEELRSLIMNAYKESMYFAKAYPINNISNQLLTGFVSYADNFRNARDVYSQDFKAFLMKLYDSLNPFFEKEVLSDADWNCVIDSIVGTNRSFEDKTGQCNPLFTCVAFTLLDIFDRRENGGV